MNIVTEYMRLRMQLAKTVGKHALRQARMLTLVAVGLKMRTELKKSIIRNY